MTPSLRACNQLLSKACLPSSSFFSISPAWRCCWWINQSIQLIGWNSSSYFEFATILFHGSINLARYSLIVTIRTESQLWRLFQLVFFLKQVYWAFKFQVPRHFLKKRETLLFEVAELENSLNARLAPNSYLPSLLARSSERIRRLTL